MSETLTVPENALEEVCRVIRIGVEVVQESDHWQDRISKNTADHLLLWVDEIEELLGMPKSQRPDRTQVSGRTHRW
jgi:hypothetical protein